MKLSMLCNLIVPALLVHVLLLSSCHTTDIEMYWEDPWLPYAEVPSMAEYTPSEDCPICPPDFRIGDCWQCYQAKGRMCVDKDGKRLDKHMRNTKPGVGFCCSPDSTAKICTTGTVYEEDDVEIICSPDSFFTDDQKTNSPYKDVATGDRNNQMFAYCPSITQQTCGVVGGTESGNLDMLVEPENVKKVEVSDLRYLKQGYDFVKFRGISSEEAEYDACHYMITMDKAVLKKWIPTKIQLKITKKSESLNVYIWEGPSRLEAKKSVIANNE